MFGIYCIGPSRMEFEVENFENRMQILMGYKPVAQRFVLLHDSQCLYPWNEFHPWFDIIHWIIILKTDMNYRLVLVQ